MQLTKNQSFSNEHLLDFFACKRPVRWDKHFGDKKPIVVEVGSGEGEYLIRAACSKPQNYYVGIERHKGRVKDALKSLSQKNSIAGNPEERRNICFLMMDAAVAFERLFKSRSVKKIICLFPCPWPKTKHVKFRLFSRDFLRLLNNRLSDDGKIVVVTDYYPYAQWIKRQLPQTGFKISVSRIDARFDTKYERKWKAGGQSIFFELTFRKTQHMAVALKRDIVLPSFSVPRFNPARYRCNDVRGKTSIIFKKFDYQDQNKKGIFILFVAEPPLTQKVYIQVQKKRTCWKISLDDGCRVFPTPGVAKAVKHIYQSIISS